MIRVILDLRIPVLQQPETTSDRVRKTCRRASLPVFPDMHAQAMKSEMPISTDSFILAVCRQWADEVKAPVPPTRSLCSLLLNSRNLRTWSLVDRYLMPQVSTYTFPYLGDMINVLMTFLSYSLCYCLDHLGYDNPLGCRGTNIRSCVVPLLY